MPISISKTFAETADVRVPRLIGELNELTAWHAGRCVEYRRILNAAFDGRSRFEALSDFPALPVRLFKALTLKSIPDLEVFKTLLSSGTTGQQRSRIFLDRETARAQTHALTRIVTAFLGDERLPMGIIDHPGVVKDRDAHTARAAGVIGFSQFGRDHAYFLRDEDLSPDWPTIETFLDKQRGQRLFLFGFTYMVWKGLVEAVVKSGRSLDLSGAVLIHGGGWKNLADEQVTNPEFKKRLRDLFGVERVHNYYGMVEQTGSIFMECEAGYLHSPDFVNVLVRHPRTLQPLPFGYMGLIECFSPIPRSYPGHVLLTEDQGVVYGEDGCTCGRMGKYFTVEGRLPSAELRGCSDTVRPR
jgi:hypothetical protein